VRSGAILQTDKLFTGQRDEPGDSALGLYNYNARFYSTTLGRFVSADPITKDGLNRYTYVLNNPLKQVDPTGLSARSSVAGMGRIASTARSLTTIGSMYWRTGVPRGCRSEPTT
jgi:RHS repeat-associated protein